MDLSLVLSSFALLFVAEMGDKTQLTALTLAQRYRTAPVIAGTFAAFLVLNVLAVMVGAALFRYVPQQAVMGVAGLLFLFFAWRSWQEGAGAEDDAGDAQTGGHGALVGSFLLIFVAELGDKTQLTLLSLAASTGQPWSVFVGGTLALWAVSLLGILVGSALRTRLPRRQLTRGAAALFLLFGLYTLAQAAGLFS